MGRNPRAGNNNLANLNRFEVALAKADTLEEVTDLRGKAEAIRVLAKNVGVSFYVQNRAAELRLRAERKAGKMLAMLGLRGGDRKSNGHHSRLKLADLGVTQSQSKRWQEEARITEADFERFIKYSHRLGEEITTSGLLRSTRPSKAKAKASGVDETRQTTSALAKNAAAESVIDDRKLSSRLFDTVAELDHHCSTLKNVLDPICGGHEPQERQRKAINRYLNEIEHLVGCLKSISRQADDAWK